MAKTKQADERAVPDIKHLWLKDVVDHDYDAAFDFLRIRVGKRRAKAITASLGPTESLLGPTCLGGLRWSVARPERRVGPLRTAGRQLRTSPPARGRAMAARFPSLR
jgi:hypothetical protein